METEVRTAKKRKKKNPQSGSPFKTVIIVLLSILVLVGGVFAFLYLSGEYKEKLRQNIIESGVFHEGVTIGGMDVSGMSPADARTALAAVEQEIQDGVFFNFQCDGKSYLADSSYFDISFNTEEVIEQALSLARSGDLNSLKAELDDIKTKGRAYELDYTVEPTRVEAYIHTFADSLTTAAVPASVSVKSLPIKEDTKAQAALNISLPEDGSITDKRDLFFDFVPSVDGYGIDIPALLEVVNQRTASKDFGDLDVVMANIPADVTVDTLKETLVLRGSAFTSYKSTRSNANRVFNLKKATGLVYGTVLQPGEEFSANTILGDRYEKYGWKMAPAVIGGGSGTEDQPGGGVCQISTTVYNAVLKGDMEITYRRNHSSRSGYIDGGLDATINTGTIDFKWKNNTQSPVYVFTWVDTADYTVVCEIYGEPFPDTFDTIELSSELAETLPAPETVYEVQSWITQPYWMKYKSAKDGYIYKTYATYKKDGTVVETKEIATSKYNAHALTYYVWPGFLPGTALDPAYEIIQNADGSTALANPALLNPPVSDAQVQ
ncbi:MAG: VanW family protein [Candidatus Pelethousia sp.]|nr:VanW family protein [Candidatus Pelethousia sp.]